MVWGRSPCLAQVNSSHVQRGWGWRNCPGTAVATKSRLVKGERAGSALPKKAPNAAVAHSSAVRVLFNNSCWWGLRVCSILCVISYWNRQKCQLFAPANCWNRCNEAAKSCTVDKIFHRKSNSIYRTKLWSPPKGYCSGGCNTLTRVGVPFVDGEEI